MKLAHLRAVALVSCGAFTLPGCTSQAQEPVEYDAVATFDALAPMTVGGWSIELTRADIAFGPVYFCASASGSSTLCEAAISEVASVARLDGLSASRVPVGRVRGFTGSVESASYDYGITWFDTETEPNTASALPGGHSMHFEGTATRPGTSRAFVADVDLVPQYQGQTAVPTAPAAGQVTSGAVTLEVRFDVARWFGQLDRTDASGAPYLDSLFSGATAPAQIEPGSFGHEALLVGIKNLAPPSFQWVQGGAR